MAGGYWLTGKQGFQVAPTHSLALRNFSDGRNSVLNANYQKGTKKSPLLKN